MDPVDRLRVVLVHDWLTGMRGGEAVLEGILEVVPQAEIFTLFHFPGSVSAAIESHPIYTSRLQRLASRVSDYRTLLPLFARAVRQWDLGAFDLVISSSHAVAKGVDARGRPHLCYCHTPMRYLWELYPAYMREFRSNALSRLMMAPIASYLRSWDFSTASRVVNRRFTSCLTASFESLEANCRILSMDAKSSFACAGVMWISGFFAVSFCWGTCVCAAAIMQEDNAHTATPVFFTRCILFPSCLTPNALSTARL